MILEMESIEIKLQARKKQIPPIGVNQESSEYPQIIRPNIGNEKRSIPSIKNIEDARSKVERLPLEIIQNTNETKKRA